jgi:hypothetical protein
MVKKPTCFFTMTQIKNAFIKLKAFFICVRFLQTLLWLAMSFIIRCPLNSDRLFDPL